MKKVLTDLDFSSVAKIVNLPAPANDGDAVNKAYVDSATEGMAWKDSVRVASTTNVNLASPGAAIDGVTLAADDRVLLKDQSDAAENGLYIFNGAATPMTRTQDADSFDKLEQAVVSVEEGSAADSTFRQTEVNGTLGTDDVTFGSFGTAAPTASESTSGTIEIATQVEVDAGTDSGRAVTPQTLANYSGRKRKSSFTIGDGSATSFTLNHNFNTRDITVSVYLNSGNYDEVIADVARPSVDSITIGFAAAPASNAYRVVVIA